MKIRQFLSALTLAMAATAGHAQTVLPRPSASQSVRRTAPRAGVPVEQGPFRPTWESVRGWQCPQWFKDAKFGMWAHWGPQCEAEDGDWYARFMYYPGTEQWNWHTAHFGSPQTHGLKDLIHHWKAEKWDPEALVKLYKEAGAQYFMALGNHHDNFDLWDSPYQQWNSVNMGPRKDLVKGWSDACRKHGLPMGVSIHASHAWTWLEPSQPYDGNLTAADGRGTWWEGYDPQELYAQRHAHSTGWDNSGTIHSQWAWGNGAARPTQAYMDKFQNRVLQLINDYNPSMLYFDDTVLPFYGVTDSVGLNILASYYNHSARRNGGQPQVVVMGKILDDEQKQALLWDVERGIPDRIQKKPWQTCTCIGSWHYSRAVYEAGSYKPAGQVVRMLVDIVSKNGNLLLSVPVKGDGTIDDKELAVVQGIAAWMKDNKQSIYGTRPWKTFGEGPLAEASNPLTAQGFNENNNYSSRDVRYAERHDTLFATIMAWPAAGRYRLESLGVLSPYYNGRVAKVELLGHGEVGFEQRADGVFVDVPAHRVNDIAPVFQICFGETLSSWARLQQLVAAVDEAVAALKAAAGYNTGKVSRRNVLLLEAELTRARSCREDDGDGAIGQIVEALTTAYRRAVQEKCAGGVPDAAHAQDITADVLGETADFARKQATATRFATPKHWTVDNFEIPQTDGSGTKNGIDNYPGTNCLMLGIWNDRSRATAPLADARVYQKVHLRRGRYYFGGAFDTHYNLTRGYVFASREPCATQDIEQQSLAFYPVTAVRDGNDTYGVYFSLDDEADVCLGFQADLASGAETQELRVKRVSLLRYADVTSAQYDGLVAEAEALLSAAVIGRNTGCYSPQAVDRLRVQMVQAGQLSVSESLADACLLLQAACQDFQKNGKVPGGRGDEEHATDLTKDLLVEASGFTPAGPGATRFEAPKYWTVENFRIPQTDGTGTKAGLDNYTGSYSLMMGLWNDRARNTVGSLADARIYRTLTLPRGSYYFGATFDDTWLPVRGYIFASRGMLPTADMERKSIAHYDMGACTKDGTFNGIYFALNETTTLNVGFQCDLTQGSEQQEFRAKRVRLVHIDPAPTAISRPAAAALRAAEVYNLSGQAVVRGHSKLTKGVYVTHGKKVVVW